MININITSKYNFNKLNNLIKTLPQFCSSSLEEILKNIQGNCIKLERGHNSNGIIVELIETSTMQCKGRVYADPSKFETNGVSYLFFEYFGTGENAEMEHIGTTKTFINSGYTTWLIPLDKAPRALNYPIKTIRNKQFYVAHGVKANHFMTDGSFKARPENQKIVEKKLKEMLKKL